MIGGCRDDADKRRAAKLRAFAEQLGLGESVRFCIGISNEEKKAMTSLLFM
jgi:hypothetical protein